MGIVDVLGIVLKGKDFPQGFCLFAIVYFSLSLFCCC